MLRNTTVSKIKAMINFGVRQMDAVALVHAMNVCVEVEE
jgi:hypothetical protein